MITNPQSLDFTVYPKTTKQKEQDALRNWLIDIFESDFIKERCFFATLLFVDNIKIDNANKQYGNFIHYLNRKVYGKTLVRYPNDKNPIKQVGIIEGGELSSNIHYHCLFVNPYDKNFSDKELMDLIKNCWFKLPKSMKKSDISVNIVKVHNISGAIEYSTKFYSKQTMFDKSYTDCVDLKNSYLGPAKK